MNFFSEKKAIVYHKWASNQDNTNKIEDHELKQKEKKKGVVCHKSASNGGAIYYGWMCNS